MKPLVLPLMFLFAGTAHAAGDVSRGHDVFEEECAECHSVLAGRNRMGPSLAGVVGRKVGSYPGFENYSAAMKAAGFVWTAAKLDAYLHAPQKVVPGDLMGYGGLTGAKDRQDLIAFLAHPK